MIFIIIGFICVFVFSQFFTETYIGGSVEWSYLKITDVRLFWAMILIGFGLCCFDYYLLYKHKME